MCAELEYKSAGLLLHILFLLLVVCSLDIACLWVAKTRVSNCNVKLCSACATLQLHQLCSCCSVLPRTAATMGVLAEEGSTR